MRKRSIYIIRIWKLICFCVLTAGIWHIVNWTFVIKREDGITVMRTFYAQKKNTVDVLFLGTSHAGTNIDLPLLWRKAGISSYALWGSIQPSWNTYYFLREALKTQTPKVIVYDVFVLGLGESELYSDEARQVTNIAGMNYSLNRLQSALVTGPQQRQADLFLGLPLYHSRYDELSAYDFKFYPWSEGLEEQKGYVPRYGSNWTVDLNYEETGEVAKLSDKQEEYFIKIIEFCEEKKIPLILTVTPTANRAGEQAAYNRVREIADEYGLPFYNLNQMDQELDFSTSDFSYDDTHLNTQGARKVASFLLWNVFPSYSLEDHRFDPLYDSWNRYSAIAERIYLNEVAHFKEFVFEAKSAGYEMELYLPGKAELFRSQSEVVEASGILVKKQEPQISGLVCEPDHPVLLVWSSDHRELIDAVELTDDINIRHLIEYDGF